MARRENPNLTGSNAKKALAKMDEGFFCSVFTTASGNFNVEPIIWEIPFDENGVPDLENTLLKTVSERA